MKRLVTILLFNILCLNRAQHETSFSFKMGDGNGPFLLENKYEFSTSEDSFSVDIFRFYISNIELLFEDEVVGQLEKKHHLVDFSKVETQSFNIKSNGHYDEIRFAVGVDSLTNVSGAQGGDLDPIYGMYWTWNSGYINFKMEGVSEICETRKNEFQLHIGGFMSPHDALRNVSLPVEPNEWIDISFNVNDFINKIRLEQNHTIMSPSERAVKVADIISNAFSII